MPFAQVKLDEHHSYLHNYVHKNDYYYNQVANYKRQKYSSSKLQKTEIQKTKQSKTGKDKQNKASCNGASSVNAGYLVKTRKCFLVFNKITDTFNSKNELSRLGNQHQG